jgi:nicotinamide riboside kinase
MTPSQPLVISITGPESSGKSSLLQFLRNALPNTRSVEEYARAYLVAAQKTKADDANEVLLMMRQQLDQLNQARGDFDGIIIMDTDDLTFKIWIEEVFGELPELWHQLQKDFRIDFSLLCMPDLPWVFDPMRVNSMDRDRLLVRYEFELAQVQRPFAKIQGMHTLRERSALQAIDVWFKQQHV